MISTKGNKGKIATRSGYSLKIIFFSPFSKRSFSFSAWRISPMILLILLDLSSSKCALPLEKEISGYWFESHFKPLPCRLKLQLLSR
jgi:hypothetical protein